jgi:ketosteroid isomerase-like protein
MKGVNMDDEKQAVMETIRRFLNAYAKKDVERWMEFITKKPSFLILGTNEDEISQDLDALREALKRDFSMMNNIDFGAYRNQFIETDGKLASVIIELPISYESEGKQTRTLFRYALTLAKKDDHWKVCAGMASVPLKSGTYSF